METLFPEMETEQKWWTKKDVDALIEHYAFAQGVAGISIKTWMKGNYVRNIKAARFILEYCGNLPEALKVIDNCKLDREKNRLEWSLSGDIVRNIQKYVNQKSGNGEKTQWH